MSLELIEHYSSIMPNPELTQAYCERSLPQVLWVNTLKISVTKLAALLGDDGFILELLVWHGSAFRYEGEQSIAKHWTYAAGLFQIQEEVSMLSGFLLAPIKHQRVLDMCAAPGNKTAQMSVSMQNTGTLIANDIDYGRLRTFGQIAKRLGLINVSTTIYCAQSYPNTGEYFDRIMVDAPCSCEGTIRKKSRQKKTPSTEKNSRALAKKQLGIMAKAIKLCKEQGFILYSTCTFSPIENEGVVTQVLEEFGHCVELVPLSMNEFKSSPGVKAWLGEQYHEAVRHCMRVWPEQNDTGGFFLALFKKVCSTNSRPIVTKSIEGNELRPYYRRISDRFRLDMDLLTGYQFYRSGKKGIHSVNSDHELPELLSIASTGILFYKTNLQFPKLTTAATMMVGYHAKCYVVDINQQQCQAYLCKDDVPLGKEQVGIDYTTGYVIVRYQDICLGVGLYFQPTSAHSHVLRSLFRQALI
jgi:NOL1/NOP2/sun family putative RNA methylase